MWSRRMLGSVVHQTQKYVGNNITKICVSWAIHRHFSCSRRRFQENNNEDQNLLMSSAYILWDYLRIDNPPKKSDLIFVLGNSDLRTADHAVTLFKEGFAPLVAVSGNEGRGTKGKWGKPEAFMFAERLLENDIPPENIILEPKATNTGENIRFTQKLLRNHPRCIIPQSIILVQTPFMGRRILATFLQQWEKAEEVDLTVTSPSISLEEYPDEAAGYSSLRDVAIEMVCSMQRIQHYPSLGFQVPQHTPAEVMEAFNYLFSYLKSKDRYS